MTHDFFLMSPVRITSYGTQMLVVTIFDNVKFQPSIRF